MKILCVEDDLDIATLLDNTLSASGHHVSTCNDGLEALDQIQSGDFNLVFLDLGIPELSGKEVIDRLAKDGLLDTLNIVILSANDLTRDEQEDFAKKGIKEILKKPVSLEKILQAVEKFE